MAANDAVFLGPILHQATVTLTNAEILNIKTVYKTVVAPTEDLGYASFPTRLFIPTSATLTITKVTGGGYTNTGAQTYFTLVWGPFDAEVGVTAETYLAGDSGEPAIRKVAFNGNFASQAGRLPLYFACLPASYNGNFLDDNGLYLTLNNPDGNLTGGHASNSGLLSVSYHTWNTVTGQYE